MYIHKGFSFDNTNLYIAYFLIAYTDISITEDNAYFLNIRHYISEIWQCLSYLGGHLV